MTCQSPLIYLVRHGETAWSASGQHTGLTDLPLTARGEEEARCLGRWLEHSIFDHIFTSPLQRAARTSELAGFSGVALMDADLVEWNYGAYEAKTTAEIRKQRPEWDLFRDGCPGGESPMAISARADRVIRRLRALEGNTLVFSSGHFLRALAVRWLGLEIVTAKHFPLSTAALSIVAYEDDQCNPVIPLWNDTSHRC